MKGIKWTVKYLPASAMALYPFVLINKRDSPLSASLLNHERIHLQQQVELLIIPFYIWYLLAYIYHRVKGKNHNEAYKSILFERECYQNENDLSYLEKRKIWAFINF